MRTTINIPESLYREAKAHAARQGITVSAVIEGAVRRELHPRSGPSDAPARELPVFGGSGVIPGVDLADMRDLLDRMDDGGVGSAMR